MATVSSHILNAVDGTHAAGVAVRLIDLATGKTIFETATDEGGRVKQDVADPNPAAEYELSVDAGDYWASRGHKSRLTKFALRFRMPDPSGSYHSPIIVSPNGYSVWTSE